MHRNLNQRKFNKKPKKVEKQAYPKHQRGKRSNVLNKRIILKLISFIEKGLDSRITKIEKLSQSNLTELKKSKQSYQAAKDRISELTIEDDNKLLSDKIKLYFKLVKSKNFMDEPDSEDFQEPSDLKKGYNASQPPSTPENPKNKQIIDFSEKEEIGQKNFKKHERGAGHNTYYCNLTSESDGFDHESGDCFEAVDYRLKTHENWSQSSKAPIKLSDPRATPDDGSNSRTEKKLMFATGASQGSSNGATEPNPKTGSRSELQRSQTQLRFSDRPELTTPDLSVNKGNQRGKGLLDLSVGGVQSKNGACKTFGCSYDKEGRYPNFPRQKKPTSTRLRCRKRSRPHSRAEGPGRALVDSPSPVTGDSHLESKYLHEDEDSELREHSNLHPSTPGQQKGWMVSENDQEYQIHQNIRKRQNWDGYQESGFGERAGGLISPSDRQEMMVCNSQSSRIDPSERLTLQQLQSSTSRIRDYAGPPEDQSIALSTTRAHTNRLSSRPSHQSARKDEIQNRPSTPDMGSNRPSVSLEESSQTIESLHKAVQQRFARRGYQQLDFANPAQKSSFLKNSDSYGSSAAFNGFNMSNGAPMFGDQYPLAKVSKRLVSSSKKARIRNETRKPEIWERLYNLANNGKSKSKDMPGNPGKMGGNQPWRRNGKEEASGDFKAVVHQGPHRTILGAVSHSKNRRGSTKSDHSSQESHNFPSDSAQLNGPLCEDRDTSGMAESRHSTTTTGQRPPRQPPSFVSTINSTNYQSDSKKSKKQKNRSHSPISSTKPKKGKRGAPQTDLNISRNSRYHSRDSQQKRSVQSKARSRTSTGASNGPNNRSNSRSKKRGVPNKFKSIRKTKTQILREMKAKKEKERIREQMQLEEMSKRHKRKKEWVGIGSSGSYSKAARFGKDNKQKGSFTQSRPNPAGPKDARKPRKQRRSTDSKPRSQNGRILDKGKEPSSVASKTKNDTRGSRRGQTPSELSAYQSGAVQESFEGSFLYKDKSYFVKKDPSFVTLNNSCFYQQQQDGAVRGFAQLGEGVEEEFDSAGSRGRHLGASGTQNRRNSIAYTRQEQHKVNVLQAPNNTCMKYQSQGKESSERHPGQSSGWRPVEEMMFQPAAPNSQDLNSLPHAIQKGLFTRMRAPNQHEGYYPHNGGLEGRLEYGVPPVTSSERNLRIEPPRPPQSTSRMSETDCNTYNFSESQGDLTPTQYHPRNLRINQNPSRIVHNEGQIPVARPPSSATPTPETSHTEDGKSSDYIIHEVSREDDEDYITTTSYPEQSRDTPTSPSPGYTDSEELQTSSYIKTDNYYLNLLPERVRLCSEEKKNRELAFINSHQSHHLHAGVGPLYYNRAPLGRGCIYQDPPNSEDLLTTESRSRRVSPIKQPRLPPKPTYGSKQHKIAQNSAGGHQNGHHQPMIGERSQGASVSQSHNNSLQTRSQSSCQVSYHEDDSSDYILEDISLNKIAEANIELRARPGGLNNHAHIDMERYNNKFQKRHPEGFGRLENRGENREELPLNNHCTKELSQVLEESAELEDRTTDESCLQAAATNTVEFQEENLLGFDESGVLFVETQRSSGLLTNSLHKTESEQELEAERRDIIDMLEGVVKETRRDSKMNLQAAEAILSLYTGGSGSPRGSQGGFCGEDGEFINFDERRQNWSGSASGSEEDTEERDLVKFSLLNSINSFYKQLETSKSGRGEKSKNDGDCEENGVSVGRKQLKSRNSTASLEREVLLGDLLQNSDEGGIHTFGGLGGAQGCVLGNQSFECFPDDQNSHTINQNQPVGEGAMIGVVGNFGCGFRTNECSNDQSFDLLSSVVPISEQNNENTSSDLTNTNTISRLYKEPGGINSESLESPEPTNPAREGLQRMTAQFKDLNPNIINTLSDSKEGVEGCSIPSNNRLILDLRSERDGVGCGSVDDHQNDYLTRSDFLSMNDNSDQKTKLSSTNGLLKGSPNCVKNLNNNLRAVQPENKKIRNGGKKQSVVLRKTKSKLKFEKNKPPVINNGPVIRSESSEVIKISDVEETNTERLLENKRPSGKVNDAHNIDPPSTGTGAPNPSELEDIQHQLNSTSKKQVIAANNIVLDLISSQFTLKESESESSYPGNEQISKFFQTDRSSNLLLKSSERGPSKSLISEEGGVRQEVIVVPTEKPSRVQTINLSQNGSQDDPMASIVGPEASSFKVVVSGSCKKVLKTNKNSNLDLQGAFGIGTARERVSGTVVKDKENQAPLAKYQSCTVGLNPIEKNLMARNEFLDMSINQENPQQVTEQESSGVGKKGGEVSEEGQNVSKILSTPQQPKNEYKSVGGEEFEELKHYLSLNCHEKVTDSDIIRSIELMKSLPKK